MIAAFISIVLLASTQVITYRCPISKCGRVIEVAEVTASQHNCYGREADKRSKHHKQRMVVIGRKNVVKNEKKK